MRLSWDRESQVRAGARRPTPLVSHPFRGRAGARHLGPSWLPTTASPEPSPCPPARGGYAAPAEGYAAFPRVTSHLPLIHLRKQDGEEWAFCGQGWGRRGALVLTCHSLLSSLGSFFFFFTPTSTCLSWQEKCTSYPSKLAKWYLSSKQPWCRMMDCGVYSLTSLQIIWLNACLCFVTSFNIHGIIKAI